MPQQKEGSGALQNAQRALQTALLRSVGSYGLVIERSGRPGWVLGEAGRIKLTTLTTSPHFFSSTPHFTDFEGAVSDVRGQLLGADRQKLVSLRFATVAATSKFQRRFKAVIH